MNFATEVMKRVCVRSAIVLDSSAESDALIRRKLLRLNSSYVLRLRAEAKCINWRSGNVTFVEIISYYSRVNLTADLELWH